MSEATLAPATPLADREPGSTGVLEEVVVTRLRDGVTLRECLVHRDGTSFAVRVAEPLTRRYPAPVLLEAATAAQFPGAPPADAGEWALHLARRGHRVFVHEAGGGPADASADLRFLMRVIGQSFSEQAPPLRIGPHAGVPAGVELQAGDRAFHARGALEAISWLESEAARRPAEPSSAAADPGNEGLSASQAYFETGSVWADVPEPYQVQLRELVRAMIPGPRARVLDVGCGNGLITNALARDFDLAAVDLSATALRSVQAPKCRASVTALPFGDRSFDFVYCFDVLEHLPLAQARTAFLELQRVAGRHVLVSVPLNEDLASTSVRCGRCGAEYHINGHLRSHDVHALAQLPVSEAFERTAFFLSGDVTVPPRDVFSGLAREHGFGPSDVRMPCPACGAVEAAVASPRADGELVRRALGSLGAQAFAADLPRNAGWIDRSEVLVLLTRKGAAAAPLPPQGRADGEARWEVRFGNLLQGVPDFLPGSQWPRFVQGKGTRISARGIELADRGAEQASPTMIRFPVRIASGDRILLDVSADPEANHAWVSLYGIDGLTGHIVTLLEEHRVEAGSARIAVRIPEPAWSPDRFGVALDLYLGGGARVEGIEYAASRACAPIPAARIRPGLNLIETARVDAVPVIWAFHATAAGTLRVPDRIPAVARGGRSSFGKRLQDTLVLARPFVATRRRLSLQRLAHMVPGGCGSPASRVLLERQRDIVSELLAGTPPAVRWLVRGASIAATCADFVPAVCRLGFNTVRRKARGKGWQIGGLRC